MPLTAFLQAVDGACTGEGLSALVVLRLRDIDQMRFDHGYHWGLRLPEAIDGVLARVLRPQDQCLRLNDECFAILLPQLRNRGHASLALARLQRALQHEVRVDDVIAPVLCAAGLVVLDGSVGSADQALQLADRAALAARRDGVDVRQHDPALRRAPFRVSDLREAIHLNRLHVALQPLWQLQQRRLVGVEALARWTPAPGCGFGPSEFVPVAENSGLIGEFTRWSLNASLRHFAELRRVQADLNLSFNLSPRAFIDDDIVLQIAGALRLWDVPPERVTLEVTEGDVMRDPERGILFLQRFHEAGMRVSIDDFGTGHSSFAYLQRFPASELKIDQAFVRDLAANTRTRQLVEGMIHLAHNLGLSVVAEGIEDQPTLEILRGLGCDIGQGFHIARPMAPAALVEWAAATPGITHG